MNTQENSPLTINFTNLATCSPRFPRFPRISPGFPHDFQGFPQFFSQDSKDSKNVPKISPTISPGFSPEAQADLIRKGAVHATQAAQVQADEARTLLLHGQLDALRRGEGGAEEGVAVERNG